MDRTRQQYVSIKYLRRYAEPCHRLAENVGDRFGAACVVPVRAEEPDCWRRLVERLAAPAALRPNLLVLVVNERIDDDDSVRRANSRFIREFLVQVPSRRVLPEAPLWLGQHGHLRTLLLDGSHHQLRLEPHEGVGRARKMGADLVLALFLRGALDSPWIGSTDADVVLPSRYFDALGAPREGVRALLFPFRHVAPEASLGVAIARVETHLRCYVLGLAAAHSPYAYHSLGSALAVHAHAYAAARGFPNRQAGEDFYLLAKLARLGSLRRLEGPEVEIVARRSTRVPFGTGPTLERALAEGEEFSTYDPQCFQALGFLLACLEERISGRPAPSSVTGPLAAFVETFVEDRWAKWSPGLGQCPSESHRRRYILQRFDALATLRFIHALTDRFFPRVPLAQAIAGGPWRVSPTASPLAWADSLRKLEGWLPPLIDACGQAPIGLQH